MWLFLLLFLVLVGMIFWVCRTIYRTQGRVMLEFDIHQNPDAILFSAFGEPPQFAIWLEDSQTGHLQTVFVTYRSATGDWVGKVECPDALPRWFEVYKQEMNTTTLPRLNASSAIIAVTGATPQAEHFKIRAEVPPGSDWICWIEVNLAGDFNAAYRQYDEDLQTVDIHFSGQPALVYRGKIHAVTGEEVEPELYGQSSVENPVVRPVSTGVTTAKDIFQSIHIRAIKPNPKLFE